MPRKRRRSTAAVGVLGVVAGFAALVAAAWPALLTSCVYKTYKGPGGSGVAFTCTGIPDPLAAALVGAVLVILGGVLLFALRRPFPRLLAIPTIVLIVAGALWVFGTAGAIVGGVSCDDATWDHYRVTSCKRVDPRS